MLDDKKIDIIKSSAERQIREKRIIKDSSGRFVDFFLKNSQDSFSSAKLLFEVSKNKELKEQLGYQGFNGYLWVINSSYYSMFYMTRALLEKHGIRIRADEPIHSIVFNAFVYYFYLTGKIEKNLIIDLEDAKDEAAELLGRKKAKKLVEDYMNEKAKRSKFTYEIGEIAMHDKAKTSLERARDFNEKIRRLVE